MGGGVLTFDFYDFVTAHWTEIAGSVLGLVQIVLLVRRSLWNFPFAMASVTLVGITLFEGRLYSEAGLQGFFFVVNALGWYQWSRVRAGDNAVPVGWISVAARLRWGTATVLLSFSLGWIMHTFTNAALPFADSAVTGASIAAQLLLNNRRIENWLLWVAIDVASIALYLTRDLYFLAVLYVAFLVISVIGLREWTRAAHRNRANNPL